MSSKQCTTKFCKKCQQWKPPTDFYRMSSTRDGLWPHCKTCDDARRALWDRQHPARAREIHLRWVAAHPGYNNAKYRRRCMECPERTNATKAVNHAIQAGKLSKPDICRFCGMVTSRREMHGHHPDYAFPLEVVWLCRTCHNLVHHPITRRS